jgi:hypothetical protein
MATLQNTTIAATYPLLLKIEDTGIQTESAGLKYIQDGDATNSTLKIATDAISVNTGSKIYLDGGAGGGATYLQENTSLGSGDGLDIVVGGATMLRNHNRSGSPNLQAFGDIVVPGDKKLRLDGLYNGDTYIHNDDTDKIDFYVGGQDMLVLDQDNNKIILRGNMDIYGNTAGSTTEPYLQLISNPGANIHTLQVAGSGASSDTLVLGNAVGPIMIGNDANQSYGLNIRGDSSNDFIGLQMQSFQPKIRYYDTGTTSAFDIQFLGSAYEMRFGSSVANNANSSLNLKYGSCDGGADSDDGGAWFNGKVGINGNHALHATMPNIPLTVWGQTATHPIIKVTGSATNGYPVLENTWGSNAVNHTDAHWSIGTGYSNGALTLGSYCRVSDSVIASGIVDVTTAALVSSGDSAATYGAAITIDGAGSGGVDWEVKTVAGKTSPAVGADKALVNTMRLGRDGKLGIGSDLNTSGPSAPIHIRTNNMTGSSGYAMIIENTPDDAATHGIQMILGKNDGSTGSGGDTFYGRFYDNDLTEVGRMLNQAGVFSFDDSSDIRLKENIVDTTVNGLDSINAVKVRDFKWKRNVHTVKCGLIAQELIGIDGVEDLVSGTDGAMIDHLISEEIPAIEAVTEQRDDNDNIIIEGVTAKDKVEAVYKTTIDPMGINKAGFTPILIKAIQELSAKVTALEEA